MQRRPPGRPPPRQLLTDRGDDVVALGLDARGGIQPLPHVQVVLEGGVGDGGIQVDGQHWALVGYRPLDIADHGGGGVGAG